MKNFFYISIFCITCNLNAQNYRILYRMSYRPDSTSHKVFQKSMILDINQKKVKFHSLRMFESDSINKKYQGTGMEGVKQFIDYEHSILKDVEKNEMYKFFTFSFPNVFRTVESIPVLNWKIKNETKLINKFICQKAIVTYGGRVWEAWFTSEIPLQQGPHLFAGLPGLIIAIRDLKDNYLFEFMSLKRISTYEDFNTKSITVSKQQLKELSLSYYADPFKELKLNGGRVKIENSEAGGNEANITNMTVRRRADLKQFNNPIVLSDIIHFP